MATLQVRDIDSGLYETLKRMAQSEHRSLSQEVIRILETYVQKPDSGESNQTEDFLALCGSWQDERSAQAVIKDIRSNRRNSGRFGGPNVIFD